MDLAATQRPEQAVTDSRMQAQANPPRRWWRSGGLFAAFGLFAVIVALGWFRWLDKPTMIWTAHHRERLLADVADLVVTLATPQLLILLTLLVSVWRTLAQRRGRPLLHAGIRTGLLVVSVLSLKDLLARAGPALHAPFRTTPLDHWLHLAQTGPAGAFPSGHTTSTLVCFGVLLGISWPPDRARRRVLVGVVAVVSAALVYMGYHWLSDVIGAWLLGAAILAVPLPEKFNPYVPRLRRPRRALAPPARPRRQSASTPPTAGERAARR